MRTLFFLVLLLGITLEIQAQKVQFEKVPIEYIQYPLNPLDASVKTIMRTVERGTGYFVKSKGGTALEREILNFNKLNTVQENGDLEVHILLYGVSLDEPERISTQKTVYDGNGGSRKEVFHKYKVSYAYPIEVKIINHITGDAILYHKTYNNKSSLVTEEFNSSHTLSGHWSSAKRIYVQKVEDQYTQSAWNTVKKHIEDNYCEVKRHIDNSFLKPKPKKHNYGEYDEAIEKIREGFGFLKKDNKEQGNEKLEEAIKIWKQAIAEVEIDNRKARINKDIAFYTLLNCAKAKIWLDDFSGAEDCLVLAEKYKPKNNKDITNIKNFIESQRVRYVSNEITFQ